MSCSSYEQNISRNHKIQLINIKRKTTNINLVVCLTTTDTTNKTTPGGPRMGRRDAPRCSPPQEIREQLCDCAVFRYSVFFKGFHLTTKSPKWDLKQEAYRKHPVLGEMRTARTTRSRTAAWWRRYLYLYLSLYVYIYIYIYIAREREI